MRPKFRQSGKTAFNHSERIPMPQTKVAEAREGGVLIRPAVILPVEVYTPERKAQVLLSNAVERR